MKWISIPLFLFILGCSSGVKGKQQNKIAENVTIIRDRWGIPHVYGKTDADAVFGVMYAQCKESFERVEQAYIEKLGRLSEVEGLGYLYQDLRMQLLYDTSRAIADYKRSPEWLKKLLHAFAAGIDYYLQQHPEVMPRVIKKFEPWFPLLFTDGAYIDTQTGGLEGEDMRALFGKDLVTSSIPGFLQQPALPVGSNGFAIAPSKTEDSSTLLYINPHVSFYFRTEMHMVSEEGLNAYGAVTWGQFFVFQGFNEHCGWMHTSSAADAADLYEETIVEQGGKRFYKYEDSLRAVAIKPLRISYVKDRAMQVQAVTTYATGHGPVVGMRNGKWLSLKAINSSMNGLIQSWQRTKAGSMNGFIEVMNLRANPSTNTVYADREGNIGYWHGNFIPKRSAGTDPFKPMDGSKKSTEWQGITALDELVHVVNPAQGFIQNCNSSPFSVSGINTVPSSGYATYQAPEGENFRSLYALQKLAQGKAWNIDGLIALGYSRYLSAFDTLLPSLFRNYQQGGVVAYPALAAVIDTLQQWDRQSAVQSAATTVAVFWAYTLLSGKQPPVAISRDGVAQITWIARNTSAKEQLDALQQVIGGLQQAFGRWQVPWGEINRFQRRTGALIFQFDTGAEHVPSPLGPAYLGSLPSFESVWKDGKQFGVAGNSFVAVVSFGKRLRAKAITTAGQGFDPSSPHFSDQVPGFLNGKFRDVYFYREDVEKNSERKYRPGE